MPYMTQKMSSGNLPATLYYRKQTQDHPGHVETEAFTSAAKGDYAATHTIPASEVELGTYRSGQGKPKTTDAEEI